MLSATHQILAYYHIVPVADPALLVAEHHQFLKDKDIRCRVYITSDGINGQMSCLSEHTPLYMEWLCNKKGFEGVQFKIQEHHEHVFPRTTVKRKSKLVAIDCDIPLEQRGEYLSPHEWRKALEGSDGYVLLDVRNRYEWEIGHFQGAELPPLETFREFETYVTELKNRILPNQEKVLMYCTGGIRCELYSALLKKAGIERVYQLQGGVIQYGMEESSKHWLGKLFVFDDRLAVPISDEESTSIGTCWHCNVSNEAYYNCANMDCNKLFLCCEKCLIDWKGCCCSDCQLSSRLRPYQLSHKPFRKWYHYAQRKQDLLVHKDRIEIRQEVPACKEKID